MRSWACAICGGVETTGPSVPELRHLHRGVMFRLTEVRNDLETARAQRKYRKALDAEVTAITAEEIQRQRGQL